MIPTLAIVGRPNVGKSTLFNRLVGGHIAITLDTPGVTRDRHYGKSTWDGHTFQVIDTGGIVFEKAGPIEKKIQEQAKTAIQEADIILLILNGREGLLPEDKEAARLLQKSGKTIFLVVNKIDALYQGESYGESPLMAEFYTLGSSLFAISAEHGLGVNDLLDEVVKRLPSGKEKKSATQPIKVAIIGRPNVGKSSLLNHLLGEERVIVHDEPGTTRDSIDTLIHAGDRDYLLIDTAGIRRGGNWKSKVERYSVLNAVKSLERADIGLLILDAKEGIHKQDAHVAGIFQKSYKGVVVLWNKWDLVKESKDAKEKFFADTHEALRFMANAPIFFISAKTGRGCDSIWFQIDRLFADCHRRVSTADVNAAFEKLVDSHNPPVYQGKPLKFYYATQVGTFPPRFIVFVNQPKGVHFSYERYLLNGLRELLRFGGAPIRLTFRKKNG